VHILNKPIGSCYLKYAGTRGRFYYYIYLYLLVGPSIVSTPNDEEALLNIVQNSPFTDAVAAVNITNLPGSVWTARRRIEANNLRHYT
jgi:hypothetical protein